MQHQDFGWSDFFASQLANAPAGIPGRVASANHGRFLVWTQTDGEGTGEVDASVGGLLRKAGALWPSVGDWVVLRNDGPVIDHVLTRKTCVSRKQPEREIREQVLAANIDVLFIVSGLDRDYNPRRIERFLVMANESGARPVVLLNKADLAPQLGLELDEVVAQVQLLSPTIPVLPISAKADHDLGAVAAQLAAGETAALIGSSGVGKSTILNRLLGDGQQATGEVRASDSRAIRNGTKAIALIVVGGGIAASAAYYSRGRRGRRLAGSYYRESLMLGGEARQKRVDRRWRAIAGSAGVKPLRNSGAGRRAEADAFFTEFGIPRAYEWQPWDPDIASRFASSVTSLQHDDALSGDPVRYRVFLYTGSRGSTRLEAQYLEQWAQGHALFRARSPRSVALASGHRGHH